MLKASTGLRNGLANADSLAGLLATGVIKIYAGSVPATADAALGGATLLSTITGPASAALAFDATVTGGVLTKDPAQAWEGTNVATGTASFMRHVVSGDDGTASTTQVRLQGDVATAGAFMNLSSVSLVNGSPQTIDYYSLAIPTL